MPLEHGTVPAAPPRSAGVAPAAGRPRRAASAAASATAAAGVAAVAAWLRAGPLGPSSLWLDDAWVALVTRAGSVVETAWVGATAPGFAFLLQGWLALAGFTETRAQALPFVLGVAGPAVLFLVAVGRRISAAAALVAATLLATAPVHITYATRVKHYTLDTVLALGVVAVTWWALDDLHRPRRWLAVTAVAVVATAASGALAVYAAAAFAAAAVALKPGAPDATPPARRWALSGLAAYAAFAAGWSWVVVRPAANPHLRAYWDDRYIDVRTGPAAALADAGRNLADALAGLSPLPVPVVAALAVAGAVALAMRRPPVAALLTVPLVAAVGLAAARMAPLGGGRTDVYLYPAVALLVAVGIDGVVRWRAGRALAAAGGVAALLLAASPADDYPAQDVRPLVDRVERLAEGDDAIVVYPATVWAYALYTDRDVDLVRDTSQGWGFEPVVSDPRIVRLGRHRDAPGRYAPELRDVAAHHDTFWLLASHWRDDLDVIEAHIADAGFVETARWERPGARLSRYVAAVR